MPVDPMIARPFVPDVTNTLVQIAALRQRDKALANDSQQNALYQQRLDYQQQQDQAQAGEAQQTQALKQRLARTQWLLSQPDVVAPFRNDPQKAAVLSQNLGMDVLRAPEPQVRERLQQMMQDLASQLGQGPPEVQQRPEVVQQGGYGYLFDPKKGVIPGSVQEPQRAPVGGDGGFRTLTPQQVTALGLPPGTVAQVGQNGKIDVVSSRPQQSLTPKDASSARVKLRQIGLAKQQLALVRQKYAELKDSFSSGPGGGYIPTVKGKAADAAVNSMRDTLTSITRVPGIGAMSDFETRLSQAKFPDRGQYEQVSGQQIQSIQDLLDGLEQGYKDMLGDGESSSAPADSTHPADIQDILKKYQKKTK